MFLLAIPTDQSYFIQPGSLLHEVQVFLNQHGISEAFPIPIKITHTCIYTQFSLSPLPYIISLFRINILHIIGLLLSASFHQNVSSLRTGTLFSLLLYRPVLSLIDICIFFMNNVECILTFLITFTITYITFTILGCIKFSVFLYFLFPTYFFF